MGTLIEMIVDALLEWLCCWEYDAERRANKRW